MAHLTLVQTTGGNISSQAVSSRTETDSYGDQTSYVTYELSASAAAGWTFSGWEYRSRSTSRWGKGSSPTTSAWSGWMSAGSLNPLTKELKQEARYDYTGTIIDDIEYVEYEFEYRAVFTQATYLVSVRVSSDSPANCGSTTGGGSFQYGASCTVTATANSGFVFKKWTTADSAQAAAVSTSSAYTFTVTGNVTLYAHFMGATGKLLHGSSGTLLHGSSGTLLYDG